MPVLRLRCFGCRSDLLWLSYTPSPPPLSRVCPVSAPSAAPPLWIGPAHPPGPAPPSRPALSSQAWPRPRRGAWSGSPSPGPGRRLRGRGGAEEPHSGAGGRSAAELRESWSEFPEFPLVVTRPRLAGAPAPFLPLAFRVHPVPASAPDRHGATAGA